MTYQETFDKLNEQLKDVPKSQVRSLSLEVLPRLMAILHAHKSTCHHCQLLSNEGEGFVNHIAPLFGDNPNELKKFEDWVERAQKHLSEAHQLKVKGRTVAAYAAVGALLGIVWGIIHGYITEVPEYIGIVSSTSVIGMLVGYVLGKMKEKALKRDHRLY